MREWVQRRTTEVWQKRVTVACWAHQQLTSKYRSHARTLNVVIVALNAMIGSAIFSSLADSKMSFWLRSFAGAVSMIVAVIAAVKSELNFDGLHEQHRMAFRGYDRLKQKLETFRQVRFVSPVSDDGQLNAEWADFLEEVNTHNTDAPTIPEDVRAELERRYEAGMELERRSMQNELEILAEERRGKAFLGGGSGGASGGHGPFGAGAGTPFGSERSRCSCGRPSAVSFSKLVPPGPTTGGVTPERRTLLQMADGGDGLLASYQQGLQMRRSGSAWGTGTRFEPVDDGSCSGGPSARRGGGGAAGAAGDEAAASPELLPAGRSGCEMPALLAHATSFSSMPPDSPNFEPRKASTAYTC